MQESAHLEQAGVPAPENRRHYPGLDGLRAVAVLMVMFEHYLAVALPSSVRWGWTGVRIFFVLSGFLITGILFDTQDAARRWSVFYARRALRIFPLYYAVLLIGVLLYPLCRWQLHPSYVLWPLYLQNYARFLWPGEIASGAVDHLVSTRFTHPRFLLLYGHFWSLCVEEQFYLIWPLVVFSVRRRDVLMKICLVVVVVSPLLRALCSLTMSPVLLSAGFEERFTFLQFDGLLLGAFFALWMRGPCPNLTKVGRWLCGVIGAVAVAAAVLCPRLYHRPLIPAIGDPIFASLGYSCVNVAAAGFVLLAINPRTVFSRVLQHPWLRWLGSVSYGFYVLHDLPHVLYERITPAVPSARLHLLLTAAIALVGTLLLSAASFYGFERPFLRMKNRFTLTRAEVASGRTR